MDAIRRVESVKEFLLTADSVEKKMTAIKRLERIPMTLNVLLETGIGKIVNALRQDPKLGDIVKMLIKKWKQVAISTALESGKEVKGSKNACKPIVKKAAVVEKSPILSTSDVNKKADQNEKPSTSKSCAIVKRRRSEDSSSAPIRVQSVLTIADGSFEDALRKVDQIPIKVKKLKPQEAQKASTQMAARRDAIVSSLSASMQSSSKSSEVVAGPVVKKICQPDESSSIVESSFDYLQDVLRKKRNRAQIYAGKRTAVVGKASSLFEICVRVLCENIDALAYTGGVPMDILQPVLLRATPAQLLSIESYNPYLIEDTQVIWKNHCSKEFPGSSCDLSSGERWRDVYQRKMDERDKKLIDVTSTISASMAMQAPTRTAQLADAKAPRDVLRKQLKYGTSAPSVCTAEELLRSKRCREAGVTDKRQLTYRVASENDNGMRSRDRTMVKPAKAPLMLKTLKMMKQCKGAGRRY